MDVIATIYYFLPAYFANMAPTYISKYDVLKKPLDFGKKFRGRRILGANKTIQGFVFAVILGTSVFYIQKILFANNIFRSLAIIDYNQFSPTLGFLLAFGAIFGDSVESFFKRQAGIPPGRPWIPFDQLDYSTFALLFSFIMFIPDRATIIFLWLFSGVLSMLFHYLGYLLGITKDKI
jgi:CDP-2,3-bis-(O-geranylgeranyl)-sn-glycerol synthase